MQTFCKSRKNIIEKGIETYGKSRDEIKQVWTSLLNGGAIPDWYEDHLARRVQKEVWTIRQKIKQANPSQQGAGTGNVKYISDFEQRTRNKPLQPQLFSALQTAATQTKLDVVIFSGGQDQFRRTGSKRHDNGWGADVYIYNGNKQLDCRREDDLGFLTAFVKACRSAGCTGAGMGPNYMGGTGLHIDMASGNSIPSQGVVTWGDHLAGGGGRTPAWLTQAMGGGGMPGLNLPGGNIGNIGLA